MAITHVIRGDDHLNNAFRQTQIYRALDWPVPEFAHVPLIHGPDGTKMSKRHGAVGIEAYRDIGYLPEALRNYLSASAGAIATTRSSRPSRRSRWFDLDAVGRAPARFDFAKLDNLNGHYIRVAADERLVALTAERLEKTLGHPLSETDRARLLRAMPELKLRPKTLAELAANARFLVDAAADSCRRQGGKVTYAGGAAAARRSRAAARRRRVAGRGSRRARPGLRRGKGVKLGAVAQPLRAALTGSTASPGIFEVMEVLGREETLGRIADAAEEETDAVLSRLRRFANRPSISLFSCRNRQPPAGAETEVDRWTGTI